MYTTFDLRPQDPVFNRKILVAQEKFFINRPRNVGKHSSPFHNYPHDQLDLFDRFLDPIDSNAPGALIANFCVKMVISRYGWVF